MTTREILSAILAFLVGALVMTLLLDRVLKIEVTHKINWPMKPK